MPRDPDQPLEAWLPVFIADRGDFARIGSEAWTATFRGTAAPGVHQPASEFEVLYLD